MKADHILLLGEGERDVGRVDPTQPRRPPCDFEGDLPRLVRRLSVFAGGGERFGYAVAVIRNIANSVPLAGRPTRIGGKAKQLRNAVIAAIQTHAFVIALIDARADELAALRRDIQDILAQCRERDATARVAIGLAIHEVEIWMLADMQARKAAFGDKVGAQPVPDDLEAIGDPKSLWSERAGQSARAPGVDEALHADTQRRAAWEALDPRVVAHRCPRGFAPFAAAVSATLPWAQE